MLIPSIWRKSQPRGLSSHFTLAYCVWVNTYSQKVTQWDEYIWSSVFVQTFYTREWNYLCYYGDPSTGTVSVRFLPLWNVSSFHQFEPHRSPTEHTESSDWRKYTWSPKGILNVVETIKNLQEKVILLHVSHLM